MMQTSLGSALSSYHSTVTLFVQLCSATCNLSHHIDDANLQGCDSSDNCRQGTVQRIAYDGQMVVGVMHWSANGPLSALLSHRMYASHNLMR